MAVLLVLVLVIVLLDMDDYAQEDLFGMVHICYSHTGYFFLCYLSGGRTPSRKDDDDHVPRAQIPLQTPLSLPHPTFSLSEQSSKNLL